MNLTTSTIYQPSLTLHTHRPRTHAESNLILSGFFNLCNFNIPVSFESSHFSEKVFNCEPLKMCIFLTSSDDQSQSDDYQSQTFSQDQVVITWTRAITDIYVHGNNQGISFQLNKLLTFLNGIWHIFCWKYLDDLPKQITSIIIQFLNYRLSSL